MESETLAGDAAGNYTIVRTSLQQTPVATTRKPDDGVEDDSSELSIPADYTAECSTS